MGRERTLRASARERRTQRRRQGNREPGSAVRLRAVLQGLLSGQGEVRPRHSLSVRWSEQEKEEVVCSGHV